MPTTYHVTARDVYEEGALLFPVRTRPAQLRGRRRHHPHVPAPDPRARQWRGDYLALIGAARIGERMLLDLARRWAGTTLDAYSREWFDYASGG